MRTRRRCSSLLARRLRRRPLRFGMGSLRICYPARVSLDPICVCGSRLGSLPGDDD
ncbi:hypothetical protein LINGRAPRIM_LOCUS1894 [Linum grandiflorum]